MDDVEALEQAAVLALPPALTEHVGGWLLRATPGVGRRRINAVLPPRRADPAELPVVLGRARAFAEQHGHELSVQVTPYAEQAPLDAALDERGWTLEEPTDVLLRPPGRGLPAPAYDVSVGALDDAWLVVHAAVVARDDLDATVGGLFARMPEPLFLVARTDGEPGAVALLSGTPGLVAVFNVGTLPAYRGRGLASALLSAAADVAGDRALWLQVGTANPAGRLYARLGFGRCYGYAYRVPP